MPFSLLFIPTIAILLISMSAQALRVSQCFAYADSIYEQAYCEIKADIPQTNLPDFWQFKKNSEQMQFLLIKRHARQLNISLPKPSKPAKRSQSSIISSESKHSLQSTMGTTTTCQLADKTLSCGKNLYLALGNLKNSELSTEVLKQNFQLNLPVYNHNNIVINKREYNPQLISYLKNAYAIYLKKMIAIGLAAETFSFNKFVYFFEEHQKNGTHFNQRFEKMFGYLKNDKKKLGVNTKISIPQSLNTKSCITLKNLVSCPHDGRNYIFKKRSI